MEILFFSGTFCASCKAMYPIIDQISNDYKDRISVSKIDVELNQQLALKHNITSIPTMIFIKDEKTIDKVVGPLIKSKLIKKIDGYLS